MPNPPVSIPSAASERELPQGHIGVHHTLESSSSLDQNVPVHLQGHKEGRVRLPAKDIQRPIPEGGG